MSPELMIAAGGLFVAALSVAATIWVTRMTLRSQRQLMHDQWLWEKRSEAYISVIEYQRSDPGFSKLLPPDVASRLIAFGSEDANRALGAVRAAEGPFSDLIDALVGQMRSEMQGHRDAAPLHVTTRWR
jgi:hypothetical protein